MKNGVKLCKRKIIGDVDRMILLHFPAVFGMVDLTPKKGSVNNSVSVLKRIKDHSQNDPDFDLVMVIPSIRWKWRVLRCPAWPCSASTWPRRAATSPSSTGCTPASRPPTATGSDSSATRNWGTHVDTLTVRECTDTENMDRRARTEILYLKNH